MSESFDVEPERLVIAIFQVAGATAALEAHGDAATLRVGRAAHAVIAKAAERAGGRVIKALGEGLLLTFPVDRARDAVAALQSARDEADAIWRAFDAACEAQVKANVGRVLVGRIGPAGDERVDIYGHALNQLFKAKAGPFTLLPELATLVAD